jgi:hypothetical protein
MLAPGALIQLPGFNKIGVIVATARAAKAIGPFPFDEIAQTIALGAKSSFELPGTHCAIHGVHPLYRYAITVHYLYKGLIIKSSSY